MRIFIVLIIHILFSIGMISGADKRELSVKLRSSSLFLDSNNSSTCLEKYIVDFAKQPPPNGEAISLNGKFISRYAGGCSLHFDKEDIKIDGDLSDHMLLYSRYLKSDPKNHSIGILLSLEEPIENTIKKINKDNGPLQHPGRYWPKKIFIILDPKNMKEIIGEYRNNQWKWFLEDYWTHQLNYFIYPVLAICSMAAAIYLFLKNPSIL